MCYHLKFAKEKINSSVDTVHFSDSEYYDFVKSVFNDNDIIIRNEIGALV
jgi:ACT domain-containing protein